MLYFTVQSYNITLHSTVYIVECRLYSVHYTVVMTDFKYIIYLIFKILFSIYNLINKYIIFLIYKIRLYIDRSIYIIYVINISIHMYVYDVNCIY